MLLDFSDCFYPRFLENMHFASTGARFLRFSLKTCFCNFHAFSVQKTYQKPFQNEVRTLPKSMPTKLYFSTSIFWGFGLDFGASWASKSAALLAAPGVLNPTAFYACINILHVLTRGRPQPSGMEAETPHVGG